MSHILTADIKTLADEVVRYLEKHAQAADTIEGISRWWIMRQRIQEETYSVTLALEYLCENGSVEKKEMTDGSVIYHRVKRSPEKNTVN